MEKPTAESLVRQICGMLEKNRTHLQAGEEVLLAGLDVKVAELCSMAATLDAVEADKFKVVLADVLQEISSFEAELRGAREQMRAQIEDLNLLRKANVAYKTSTVLPDEEEQQG